MMGAVLAKVKEMFAPAAPKRYCHTISVIEGLKCGVCGEVIPHVDRYETARLLFQRENILDNDDRRIDSGKARE